MNAKKKYLKWSLRTAFKGEKQFRSEAITRAKENCRITLY